MVDKPSNAQGVPELLRQLMEKSNSTITTDCFLETTWMPNASISAIHRMIMRQLRRSPGFRSIAYLGICFGLPYVVPSPWKGSDIGSQAANSIAGAGVLGTITWLFSRLGNENTVQQTRNDLRDRLEQIPLANSV